MPRLALRKRQGMLERFDGDDIMKNIVTVIVLTIAIASPALGQTAQRQTRDQAKAAAGKSHVQRQIRPVGRRQASRPCVGYTWRGCIGWDPDPRVRAMLLDDAHHDDW